MTVAGPRRIRTGFLFCRRNWLGQSTMPGNARQLAADLRRESVRRHTENRPPAGPEGGCGVGAALLGGYLPTIRLMPYATAAAQSAKQR